MVEPVMVFFSVGPYASFKSRVYANGVEVTDWESWSRHPQENLQTRPITQR